MSLTTGKSNPHLLTRIEHQSTHLLNVASEDMTVDGSSTAVVFEAGPASGIEWHVVRIAFNIEDTGTQTMSTFGAVAALTNGWLVEHVIDTTARTVHNIHNNADLFSFGSTTGFHAGLTGASVTTGYTGNYHFEPHITLDGTDSDIIRATVRDDLTGLIFLDAQVFYWIEV